jgi:predicted RNase H-like HicB family nuclease
MEAKFGAVIERDGDWVIAYCPEVPGANGTREECLANLRDAIWLILEDRSSPAPDNIRITHRWKRQAKKAG